MKKEQTYFIIFLILLLFLIISLDFVKPLATGKIEKLSAHSDHISIYLENLSTQIYFTNSSKIELKKEMKIQVYGSKQDSLNKSIIFADKIVLIK